MTAATKEVEIVGANMPMLCHQKKIVKIATESLQISLSIKLDVESTDKEMTHLLQILF